MGRRKEENHMYGTISHDMPVFKPQNTTGTAVKRGRVGGGGGGSYM